MIARIKEEARGRRRMLKRRQMRRSGGRRWWWPEGPMRAKASRISKLERTSPLRVV
jgi:hypothetical protein